MEKLDPKTFYLLAGYSQDVEVDIISKIPCIVQPLNAEFFGFFDEKRALMEVAHNQGISGMLAHWTPDLVDFEIFNPESYSPDGESDIADTEAMQEKLTKIWEDLESKGFAVVSGHILEECGLAELEELEDFRTSTEDVRLHMIRVFQENIEDTSRWPRRFEIAFSLTEKHDYMPWSTCLMNYDELREEYREMALANFKVKPEQR